MRLRWGLCGNRGITPGAQGAHNLCIYGRSRQLPVRGHFGREPPAGIFEAQRSQVWRQVARGAVYQCGGF